MKQDFWIKAGVCVPILAAQVIGWLSYPLTDRPASMVAVLLVPTFCTAGVYAWALRPWIRFAHLLPAKAKLESLGILGIGIISTGVVSLSFAVATDLIRRLAS